MARKYVRKVVANKKRKDSYDTYVSWLNKYNPESIPMSREDYKDVVEQYKIDAKETGSSTGNMAKRIASDQAFDYDINTSRNIVKYYNQQNKDKITVRDVRNWRNNPEVANKINPMLSDMYSNIKDKMSASDAALYISQTVFGSD